jgi:hypothetical protein
VSCRSRPPRRIPRPARQSLRGPRDALDVITLAVSHPARPETICLLLDRAHRGFTVVIIEGSGPDDDLMGLGDLLIGAAADSGAIGAVVIATVRPDRSHLPDANDERRWFDLRVRFDEAGVELLDWFVLSGGLASSLCELTDSRWRWLDD